MVSDLRLPGGTTVSMAEEVRAQTAAGYRTALLHVNSSLGEASGGVSVHLRRLIDDGVADLILPGDRVRARHAVVRHPAVAQDARSVGESAAVDGVSLIANHPLADRAGVRQYEPARATEALVAAFGKEPTWWPIGPLVRRQLSAGSGIDLAADDWTSPLDLDDWARRERTGVHGTPVIGRHSRPHPAKWPESKQDLLAAYPDAPDLRVRVLGGADPARTTLGAIPQRWLVEPYGARPPADFLADLDFFVYFHHSNWVEASGRHILEALASGAVALLPAYLQETYGDAALYATPGDVRSLVTALTADPDAYRAQVKRGQSFVAGNHGHHAYVSRLRELVGPPSVEKGRSGPRRRSENRTRVLFVSSNGTGMGHLTRLLAMANRSGDRIEPFFFSMSSAVPVVRQHGYAWEYCPSRDELDVTAKEWNPFFAERFADVVRRYRPQALVFDGTWPYQGLGDAREMFPDLLYVWSRRAMWRAGHRAEPLEKSDWFDLIIEPGEFAAAADRGPTVDRTDAIRVPPVTLLDRGDLLTREKARAELGMDADEKAILVMLGGGNAHDLADDLEAVAAAAALRSGLTMYVTRAPIARAGHPLRGDVRTISAYPMARSLPAFDAAVVACGYNTYHESIVAAVPTVFVPKAKVTDDQHARARHAEESGVGVALEEVTVEAVDRALERVLDPAESDRMRERCLEMSPDNGAGEAMRLVESLLEQRGAVR